MHSPTPVTDPAPAPTDTRDLSAQSPPHSQHVLKAIGALLALATAIMIVVTCFALPASRSAPRELPIGVAGPPQLTAPIITQLNASSDGRLAAAAYPNSEALRTAIEQREIYGGVAPSENTTFVASGASPAVATQLSQVLAARPGSNQPPMTVTDLAPLGPDDPTGAGFGSVLIPTFLAGLFSALLVSALSRRAKRGRSVALIALPTAAVTVAGALTAAVAALGVIEGGRALALWGAASLAVLAIASVIAGAMRLLGPAGIGAAVVTILIVGMPLAGFATAPEFLPSFWSGLGQALPLGAAGQTLRSAAYFGEFGWGTAHLVLAAYAVVGLAMLAAPKRTKPTPASVK